MAARLKPAIAGKFGVVLLQFIAFHGHSPFLNLFA